MKLSTGEKLIAVMVCELHEKLGIRGAFDPTFVRDAILDGQLWALDWEYQGLLPDETDYAVVKEVTDILDMWSFIEEGFEALSDAERKQFAKDCAPFKEAEFMGFDGNNEVEHIGVARFLTEKMERFTRFKGRSLNCHCPSLDQHRHKLAIFEPIRPTLVGKKLNLDQLVELMKA